MKELNLIKHPSQIDFLILFKINSHFYSRISLKKIQKEIYINGVITIYLNYSLRYELILVKIILKNNLKKSLYSGK